MLTCSTQMGVSNENVVKGAMLVQCHAPLGMPFSAITENDFISYMYTHVVFNLIISHARFVFYLFEDKVRKSKPNYDPGSLF